MKLLFIFIFLLKKLQYIFTNPNRRQSKLSSAATFVIFLLHSTPLSSVGFSSKTSLFASRRPPRDSCLFVDLYVSSVNVTSQVFSRAILHQSATQAEFPFQVASVSHFVIVSTQSNSSNLAESTQANHSFASCTLAKRLHQAEPSLRLSRMCTLLLLQSSRMRTLLLLQPSCTHRTLFLVEPLIHFQATKLILFLSFSPYLSKFLMGFG